jgi:CheY-like chemotaxis protein
MVKVSLSELRSTLLREFDQVAAGQGVDYSIVITPGCPETIVTDPQRLRQILKNLLANAFKFTKRGQVKLEIGPTPEGWSSQVESLASASSIVALSVTDTGIGIDDEQQQRIFEAFEQADGTTARLYGGTGLGLSISRELVGLLGGEIVVTSTPGTGSVFTIFLPGTSPADVAGEVTQAAIPAPDDLVPHATPHTEAAVTPLRSAACKLPGLDEKPFAELNVLVVDDDFRNIFAMTALLERGGAGVTVAENGPEAIAALDLVPDIDLVLMDIMMPGMDGYATIRAIRGDDRFQALPILAVTGKVVSGERQRCLDAGANDYVPKPVDTVELLTAIGPWLPPRTTQRSA